MLKSGFVIRKIYFSTQKLLILRDICKKLNNFVKILQNSFDFSVLHSIIALNVKERV